MQKNERIKQAGPMLLCKSAISLLQVLTWFLPSHFTRYSTPDTFEKGKLFTHCNFITCWGT